MILSAGLAAFLHFILIIVVGFVPLNWKVKDMHLDLFLCFGAGVLLSAVFMHMIPSAIPALGPMAGAYVLGGYILMVLIEKFTIAHPCGEDHCANTHHHIDKNLSWIAFFGLSIHSIVSGLALGIGIEGETHLHIAVAMLAAILVHKVPETLALVGLFVSSKWTKKRIIPVLFMYAVMGPMGILIGSRAGAHSEYFLNIAMMFSAGTFLYLGSGDLLPYLHKKMRQQWLNIVAFILGLLLLSVEALHHLHG